MNTAKPSLQRSRVNKFLRIGCLSIFAITVIIIVIVAGILYSVYAEFNETKVEYSSARAERKAELINGLNAYKIEGIGGHFYIAFAGCDVYQTASGSPIWNKVALKYRKGSYAKILTACDRTDSWQDEEWLYVSTCAQALGAGGGCGRGDTFKTQDGIQWFRREGIEPRETWVNAL